MRKWFVVLLMFSGAAYGYSYLMTSGKIYFDQGEYQKAIEKFKQAAASSPNDPKPYIWLGRCYTELKDYVKATDYFDSAMVKKPEIIKKMKKGQKYKRRRYDAMFFWRLYSNAGIILLQQNEFRRAINKLKTALKFNPDSAVTYNNIGYCFAKLAKEDTTLKDSIIYYYNKAIETNPKSVLSYVNLARFYLKEEDYKKASEYLSKAVELDSTNVDALYYLGICYMKMKNYSDAELSFRKLLKLDSTNVDARYNLAACLEKQNKIKEAIAELEKAHEIKKEDIGVLDYLDYLYERIGDLKSRERVLSEWIEIKPDDPRPYARRAAVRKKLGDIEGYKADMAKYKELR